MREEILSQMQKLVEDEIANLAGDLGTLETHIMQAMMSFGKNLLQRVLDHHANGYQGSSVACRCGGSMRFVQHRPRNIHTLFGWITLKRAYYHCPACGTTLAPYDKASGLGSSQLSPGLAKACCLLAVDDSFQQVSQKLQQLFGQRVCDDAVKEMVHQVGKVALEQQDQQYQRFFTDRQSPQAQANPKRLYVSPDGTTVHENDGWHEAKIGCIWWEDECFESHKRYVGGFDDSQSFGWHLWLEACRCGVREAGEVVYIGDGAGWIRTEHDSHFGKAVFITDWYHASQHVWDCGKELFGEGTRATETWVAKRLDWLWDGWTKKLLDDLKKQRKRHRGRKRQAIEKLYHYVLVNEQQMRYDVFRASGYDIGSGVVEAACKNVVGKRLKQSGMIWSRAGSSATLALRITWLNKRWEQLWSQKPMAA
jgi:hypothetical protein